jgi:hypothetical protein
MIGKEVVKDFMAILYNLERACSEVSFYVGKYGGNISGPELLGNLEGTIWDVLVELEKSLSNPEEHFDVTIRVQEMESFVHRFLVEEWSKKVEIIKRPAAALMRFVNGCELDEVVDRDWLEAEKENDEQFNDELGELGSSSFSASLSKMTFAAMVAAGAAALN